MTKGGKVVWIRLGAAMVSLFVLMGLLVWLIFGVIPGGPAVAKVFGPFPAEKVVATTGGRRRDGRRGVRRGVRRRLRAHRQPGRSWVPARPGRARRRAVKRARSGAFGASTPQWR